MWNVYLIAFAFRSGRLGLGVEEIQVAFALSFCNRYTVGGGVAGVEW